jgi:hypothetical protein
MLGRVVTGRMGSGLAPCALGEMRCCSRPVLGDARRRISRKPFAAHAPQSHALAALGSVMRRARGSRPFSSAARRIRDAYGVYDQLLQTHRLATTTATGAVLAFAGDLCTQTATHEDGLSGFDPLRGISFAFFGAAVTGPVNYVWLSRLDTLVTRLAPSGGCACRPHPCRPSRPFPSHPRPLGP